MAQKQVLSNIHNSYKKLRYLGLHLINYVKELHNEHYKTLMKDAKMK